MSHKHKVEASIIRIWVDISFIIDIFDIKSRKMRFIKSMKFVMRSSKANRLVIRSRSE